MPATIPATGFRYWSKIPNTANQSASVAYQYVYETGVIWQQQDGTLVTGAMRPVLSTDLASTTNLSVSGLSLSVGAVSLTGDNPVRVANVNAIAVSGAIQGGNLLPVFVTGLINTVVTGAVSANVTSVAVTGGVSGSAQGNLDLTRTYLPVSGVGTFAVNSNITNTAPLAISGVVQASVTTVDTGIRAVTVTNSPTVTIGNTAPIAISGVVLTTTTGSLSATVDNTLLILAVASGNTLALAANQLLSGVSGALVTNLTVPAAVTGDIRNIPGTVLAISGIVQTVVTGGSVSATVSNPIGATGTSYDRLPFYTGAGQPLWNFQLVGGRAVSSSGVGSTTGYNTGDFAVFNFSRENGGLLVNQGTLDRTQDNATVWAANTGTGPANAVSGLAPSFFGTVLPNNPNRRGWFIANLATGVLMVKMSASIPTTGNFDVLLKGATTQFSADGASWTDSPAIYTGPVSVSGIGGAPCVYRAWEL